MIEITMVLGRKRGVNRFGYALIGERRNSPEWMSKPPCTKLFSI